MAGGSVTKIARTYKKWTYIARKQNIQLTKKQRWFNPPVLHTEAHNVMHTMKIFQLQFNLFPICKKTKYRQMPYNDIAECRIGFRLCYFKLFGRILHSPGCVIFFFFFSMSVSPF
jgi:hypothetical protein